LTDRESSALDILRDLLPFLDPSASARWDTLAELFYRDTGIMAPGKSVPMEMAMGQPPDDVREDQYRKWHCEYVTRLYHRAVAVIAVVETEAP
jgi:hypothetical protein